MMADARRKTNGSRDVTDWVTSDETRSARMIIIENESIPLQESCETGWAAFGRATKRWRERVGSIRQASSKTKRVFGSKK